MGRTLLILVLMVGVVCSARGQEVVITLPQIWAVDGTARTGMAQVQVSGETISGGMVALQTSNAAVLELPMTQVQLSPAGLANFMVRKHPNQGCNPVSLTATYQEISASESVPICTEWTIGSNTAQAAGVDAVSLFRQEVVGGHTAVATITYSYGGQLIASNVIVVNLSSSNPAVASVPPTVTVQGGMATVEIATQPVMSLQTVTISASTNSFDSKSATLTIRPETDPKLKSLDLAPASVKGGEGTVATLRLTLPAPRPIVVNLSADQAGAVQMPYSITFNTGESEKTFEVISAKVRPTKVTLKAERVRSTRQPTASAVLVIQ